MHDCSKVAAPISTSPRTVSILMTCYNREAYLADAIESVLASSYQDWELIIVDDRSSDGSFDIARTHAARDPRIQAHRNETNLGDYPNRNRAASLAHGTYLKYLDSDDLIYPHGLQVMVDAMERFPEAALGLCWNIVDPPSPYPIFREPHDSIKNHYLGTSPLGVGPSGAIIRRTRFEEVGGFTGRQYVGDTELWLHLVGRWPLLSLPPALVWWRQHEGQQISQEIRIPEVTNARFILNLEPLGDTCPLDDHHKTLAMKRVKQHHARRLLALALKQRSPGTAWRLFCESGLTLGELLSGFRPYR